MNDSPKHIRDISEIKQSEDGVVIEITSAAAGVDETVKSMVDSCADGSCNCMPAAIKEKITGMEFGKNQGKSAIFIKGNVTVEDMKQTMNSAAADSCCTIGDTSGSCATN